MWIRRSVQKISPCKKEVNKKEFANVTKLHTISNTLRVTLGEKMDLTGDKSDINMNQIQHLTYLSAFDQVTQNSLLLTRKAHQSVTARETDFIHYFFFLLLLFWSGKEALVSMTLSVKNPNKDGTCQIFDVKKFQV